MSFFVFLPMISTRVHTCNDSLTLSKSLFYIKGVQMTTRKKLCTIKGISEAKMEKIKEAANKLCVGVGICFAFLCWVFSRPSTLCTVHLTNIFPSQGFSDRKPMASEDAYRQWSWFPFQDPGFLTALEYADKRKQVFRITTGSQELE